MSTSIDFESSIGPNDFPVIVYCTADYERADPDCGLPAGWVVEIDEVKPDKDRMEHGETDEMMPPITEAHRESWRAEAAQKAESDAQSWESEPDYDATKAETPLENWQRNDEHNQK